jgi:hypothetical protein
MLYHLISTNNHLIGQYNIQIDYDKITKKHKVFGFWLLT